MRGEGARVRSLEELRALLRPEAPRTGLECPLVVAAHPDDETIGASWLLAEAPEARVVHLTDGAPRDSALRSSEAPREAYARLRQAEAVAALAHVGVGPERIFCLEAVDQEAVERLVPLTYRLASWVAEEEPSVVVTHPYEGGHPDHDAAAFVVHAALALLARSGGPVRPVWEMTSYHAREGRLVTGEYLPGGEGGVVATKVPSPGRPSTTPR